MPDAIGMFSLPVRWSPAIRPCYLVVEGATGCAEGSCFFTGAPGQSGTTTEIWRRCLIETANSSILFACRGMKERTSRKGVYPYEDHSAHQTGPGGVGNAARPRD